MSIATELTTLNSTKSAIRQAIIDKGQDLTGVNFAGYAAKIGAISGGGGGTCPIPGDWTKPTEWLTLPDNVVGVQKVSMLMAVMDTDSEFVAFICAGNYTVDWGDGVIENFSANAKAQHKYAYMNANLNSDTVAAFGYKQCIITITPQSGQNLTTINLNTFHSTVGSSTSYNIVSGVLSIHINAANCTNLTVSSNTTYTRLTLLEHCDIGEIADTDFSYLFYYCYNLMSVRISDTSSVMYMNGMFYSCYSLQTIPLLNTSSVTNMNSMFYNCYSLQTIPLLNTSSVTNMNSMFQNCYSLKRMQARLKYTFSVANAKMSASALDEMYTALPSVSGQTVTVTGNYGTSGDNPSVAINKGWTVTG